MPRSYSLSLVGWSGFALAMASSCATGHIRQVRLGAPPASRGMGVVVSPTLEPLEAALAPGLVAGLAQASALKPVEASSGAYQLEVQRLSPPGQSLEFVAALRAPGEPSAFASVQWRGRVTGTGVTVAGEEAGRALGRQLTRHANDFSERRPGDERVIFAPTGDTVPAGSAFFTDEQVLLLHFGVGLGDRVQLSAWLGGAASWGWGGGAFTPGLFGGAAIGLVGVADLGLKVRVVDESRYVPAVALSYDVLDFFGAGIGVIGLLGPGAAGVGVGGAVANAQFNLFSFAASKHLGSTELVLGPYLLDNHNFLPQTARFAVAGSNGAVEQGGATVGHLPLQVQPFLAAQQVLGAHSALAVELFPRWPLSQTALSTGARWNLGWSKPVGPLALDRVRFRVELAALWFYVPPQPGESRRVGFPVGALPFLLLGISRVILNHDLETRTNGSGSRTGLLRSYEYRLGGAVAPWKWTLLDVGPTSSANSASAFTSPLTST